MTSSRHASFLPEQKLVAVFDHHEPHFPLHQRLAVFGAHDPTVKVGYIDVVGARVDDRLDCEAHARHENRALPASVAWRSARLFRDVGFAPFLPELCLGVTRRQNNASIGFSLFFLPACVGISAITKGRLSFETSVFSAKSADSTGFRRKPLTSVYSFSMKETGYSLLFCTRFEADITWK